MNTSGITVECSDCGRFMTVSDTAIGGICSTCTHRRCLSLLSDSERDKLYGVSPENRTTKPRGWRWMTEFVLADGTVYHKGVEQPDLKGTRPITDVDALYKQRKKNKEELRKKENKALLVHAKKAKEERSISAANALKKQKDFLNHKVDMPGFEGTMDKLDNL
jgi:hypothetical protein